MAKLSQMEGKTLAALIVAAVGAPVGLAAVILAIVMQFTTPEPTAVFTINPSTIEEALDGSHSATLAWITADATTVTLDGTPVAANDSKVVTGVPVGSKTYTLIAVGDGTISKSVTLTVTPHVHPSGPHPDDKIKHDEHIAMLGVPEVPNVTIVRDTTSTFTMSPGDKLHFQPRQYPRNLATDPEDFSGGLLSHGIVTLDGTPVTHWARPIETIKKGESTAKFDVVPPDWKVGDTLVFGGHGGIQLGPDGYYNSRTTYRNISEINGSTITVNDIFDEDYGGLYAGPDAPLYHQPVGHLTRDTEIYGDDDAPLGKRPHVMLMHSGKFNVHWVGFRNLGRTDGRINHTVPDFKVDGSLIEGSDSNTIGRYGGPHFHIRSGALYSQTPIECVGAVGRNSPKHLFVSHGAFTHFSKCIATDFVGSGFFFENGSEIGITEDCLAVGVQWPRQDPSPDGRVLQPPREGGHQWTPGDFGGNGFGFWLNGGGPRLRRNVAIDCTTGFAFFPRSINDSGPMGHSDYSTFLTANIVPPTDYPGPREDLQALYDEKIAEDKPFIEIGELPTYLSDFESISCKVGLVTYGFEAKGRTLIENGKIINCNNAIAAAYTRRTTFNHIDCTLTDPTKGFVSSSSAFAGNSVTSDIVFDTCRFIGYDYAPQLPWHGINVMKDCYIDCQQPMTVPAPWSGSLTIDNLVIPANPRQVAPGKIVLSNKMLQREAAGADSGEFFKPFTFTINGTEIIHDCRMPDAIPFKSGEPMPDEYLPFVGKTNSQIHMATGKWVGGKVIPSGATLDPHPMIASGGGVLAP